MMHRSHIRSGGIVIMLACLAFAAQANSQDQSELAKAGTELAEKYCYRCHGLKYNGSSELNVLDRTSLLDETNGYVIAGDVNNSYLWQRISDREMPPGKEDQPTEAEVEVFKQWIKAGSPIPERPQRDFLRQEEVMKAVLADLQEMRSDHRRHVRYFTLSHLYNNVENVSDLNLRLFRAALSKALNSLSWERQIVLPEFIDEDQTVARVDLRDLGWDRGDLWSEVLKVYPYGLDFSNVEDQDLAHAQREIENLAGTPMPYVRADWFVVTATRPPLYHTLLQLPETDRMLEDELRVDTERDFLQDRLHRAGFAESGVSTANRLVDRHSSAYGYYWKSYDFAPDRRRGNLFKFPLGPVFASNPFPQQAFEHDGGEMIFSLPNGMQGYFLADGKGSRIDEGPIAVVRDLKETSGSPVVVNGISCMHCHQNGMIRFKDTVRDGLAVFGDARNKVRDLYPSKDEMDKILKRDEEQFLRALDQALRPYLEAERSEKPIRDFPEPIIAMAQFYQRDLGLQEVAFELGIKNPDELKTAIKYNDRLKKLGLLPLTNQGRIKRSEWESREKIISPFQVTARTMDRGTPFLP